MLVRRRTDRSSSVFNLSRTRSLVALKNSVKWVSWSSWAHDWLFSDQDKHVVEKIRPGAELLSKTDVGLTAWRWFMSANARRPTTTTVSQDEKAET